MADLRDEHGNPIQLADQFGKPVQLTDEHGNPMHITGVATTHGKAAPPPLAEPLHAPEPQQLQEQLRRSGSSSSSSSEDDGEGGRRKKKGVKERIKETLGGAKPKESTAVPHATAKATTTAVPLKTTTTTTAVPATATTTAVPATTTTTTVPGHEKKGIMEKIKEKLPGHHHNH